MPVKITDFAKKDCGGLLKRDLVKSPNLKIVFNTINQHLYGKLKYTDTDTRTRSKQIINLLLCKLVDEVSKKPEEEVEFCVKNDESPKDLYKRIQLFFDENVRNKYIGIIDDNEQIKLTKELVYLIVKDLQNISILHSSKDIFSDAFEIFVSKILKDEAGQFFTPPNIVRFMVNYLNPSKDSKVLDPACGHGGFLLETKEFLWGKIKSEVERIRVVSNLFGIDKDLFLSKISRLYLDILSNGKSNIFCEDSLDPNSYRDLAKESIKDESFDYILTNPPFGVKIPINDSRILNNYQLGHAWKNINGKLKMQNIVVKQQSPQVLFIERCIQLLKDGGKLGIVLPEGIFGNPSDRYIWEFLMSSGKILGIVSLDQDAFQPFTCNKTSILFFQKLKNTPTDYNIDFATVEDVGHDKDGKISYQINKDGSRKLDSMKNPIILDELTNLHIKIREAEEFNYLHNQKIFKIKFNQIKNSIFIPAYYSGVEKTLKKLANDEEINLMSIKELTENKIIYTNKGGYLPRGAEIGSHVYGLGDIPFIRTSEISNWEVNLDSYKKTSQEVYEQYRIKQNIEENDILLVKDGGSNLIGKTAFITKLDTKIIIQSHIFQIKTLANEESIDSYLLLYLLNLDIVQKQIQAITFVQGTIATIGNRIMEVILPVPADFSKRKEISEIIKQIIDSKTEIRIKIKNLSLESYGD
ncbi:MAG: N-6 DNA methylase [Candidatus Lokiarchaeota archaeon]|nr:N-6 DNA methylase [Candidatus Lokiarchaeota archaeon]